MPTSFVDLHLDTGSFDRELKTALARGARNDLKVNIKADTRTADRNINKLTTNVNKASSGINTLTGRLDLLISTLLTVGPAAVPITAVLIPAVAGLTTVTLAAATAAGTVKLAFMGVGDALKAVNKAQLEPTAENLAAMREAMSELSPEAQTFVAQLDRMEPVLTGIRDAAAEGLFPGLTDSLSIIGEKGPAAEEFFRNFGTAIGDIARDASFDLVSGRFSDFVDYLGSTGPVALGTFTDAILDVAHGLGEILTATSGMQGDFFGWVRDAATDFDAWASSLKDSDEFQSFLDYIARNGPKVGELVGEIADLGVQLVKAYAPVGEAILPVLTTFADIIGDIASIPFAAEIVAAAAAFRLLSTPLGKVSGLMPKISEGFLDLYTSPKRAATAMGQLKGAAKGLAGPAGMLGLAATMNSTSETGLVLGGTLSGMAIGFSVGGPVGAAVGGLTGLFYGLTEAQKKSLEGLSEWDKLVGAGETDFGKFQQVALDAGKALVASNEAASTAQEELNTALQGGADGVVSQSEAMSAGMAAVDDYYANTSAKNQKLTAEQKDAIENWQNLTVGVSDLGHALGTVPLGQTVTDVGELNKIFAQAAPTLEHIGVSYEGWMAAVDTGKTAGIVDDMREYVTAVDSAAGQTESLELAVQGLDSQIITTADSTAAFASAIDAMIAPQLALGGATDSFSQSLNDMVKAAEENGTVLKGNTNEALANRDALRQQVSGVIDVAKAQAAAGKPAKVIADTLRNNTKRLFENASAAGFNKDRVKELARQYGLSPKLVRTVVEAAGVKRAQAQVEDLRAGYRRLPKDLRTQIKAEGVPTTKADIKDLAKEYKLTPKQVRTLIKLDTKAAKDDTTNINKLLDDTSKKKPKPTVDLNTAPFDGAMSGANADLTAFGNRSETATITTHHVDTFSTTRKQAGGGLIRGAGTATSDSIPARLSDGEFVVRTAAVDKYGVDFMNRVNSLRLAGGGLVQRFAAGGKAKAKRQRAARRQRRQNRAQYLFDVSLEDLLDQATEGDLEAFDEAMAMLKQAQRKVKKWSDEWVALQEQIDQVHQDKKDAARQMREDAAEAKRVLDEAVADFAFVISGDFFTEGLAAQIGEGADFRNIFGGIVSQAQDLLEMGAITQATFNQINAAAQAYTVQLEGLQDQVDAVDAQLEEANQVLADQTQVLEQAQQALDGYIAGVKDSITALGQLSGMDDGVQRQADATAELTAAQDAYNKTLATYGANSRNTAAAAARLATAQEKSKTAALTGTEILGNVQAQVAKVRSFIANVKKLRDLGVGETALREIIAMGPIQGAAYAAALASATPEVLTGIQTAQNELAAIGQEFGTEAAGWLGYFQAVDTAQAGVDAAQGIVTGLESQRQAIIDTMTSIGNAAAAAFKASLGIASPSRVFQRIGIDTLIGMQKGLVSQVPNTIGVIEGLADKLSNSGTAVTAAPATGGGGGGVTITGGIHVTRDVDIDTLTQKLDFWSRQSGRTR